MSYPRLKLEGDVTKYVITGIDVEYDNDVSGSKPAFITRSRYDIKREMSTNVISSGTAKRWPDVPYNDFRLVHTWVGYVDVTSESVSITSSSSSQDSKNVALIKTAAILNISSGIPYTVSQLYELGPDKPSLGGTYSKGFEQGVDWTYALTKTGEDTDYTEQKTDLWVIKDINIDDRGNNVSRVTFTFELKEAWVGLDAVIVGVE